MEYHEDIVYGPNGETKCILCNNNVHNSNNFISSHINEKNHKNLNEKRLMIQNNIVSDGNRKRCDICKEFLLNLEDHIESLNHQNALKKIKILIEKDGNFLELPENIDSGPHIYCIICNKYSTFTSFEIKDHLNTTQHKRARSIILQYYNGIFTVEGVSDVLWCKICQIYLENYMEVIFKHVEDDLQHIKCLKKIRGLIEGHDIDIERFLTFATEDKAYCNKCQTGVSCNVDNLERHIKGKIHSPKKK